MGYTTSFSGHFGFNRPIEQKHADYINAFSGSRRMKRHPVIAAKLKDDLRIAVGLPIGIDGAYFVGGGGFAGQDKDDPVLEYNAPGGEQPGLWCQWAVNQKENILEWDGSEKFYNYVEWLEYLIKNFFEPWGYSLNGFVNWQGEDDGDTGTIVVKHNEVKATMNSY